MLIIPIAGGILRPRLIPSIITLVCFIALCALGTWQMQRLAWKTELITQIENGMTAAPLDLSNTSLSEPIARYDYRRAKITGHFLPDKALYLAAREIESNQFGYQILMPFVTDHGVVFLVSRGWIPSAMKGQGNIPSISADTQTIIGVLRTPKGRPFMMPDNRADENFWLWVDLPAMASALGIASLAPVYMNLDATDDAQALPKGSQTRLNFTNNHLIYAFTWYSMALILLFIFGASHWTKTPRS